MRNVREYGWHCTSVGGGEDEICFAYSVGLWETFDHPEMVIFGLGPRHSHAIISKVASAAEAGQPFRLDQATGALLENYSCLFLAVSPQQYREYCLSTCWYYQGRDIPVYQIVWPSREGYFPWHPDVSAAVRRDQPILATHASDG